MSRGLTKLDKLKIETASMLDKLNRIPNKVANYPSYLSAIYGAKRMKKVEELRDALAVELELSNVRPKLALKNVKELNTPPLENVIKLSSNDLVGGDLIINLNNYIPLNGIEYLKRRLNNLARPENFHPQTIQDINNDLNTSIEGRPIKMSYRVHLYQVLYLLHKKPNNMVVHYVEYYNGNLKNIRNIREEDFETDDLIPNPEYQKRTFEFFSTQSVSHISKILGYNLQIGSEMYYHIARNISNDKELKANVVSQSWNSPIRYNEQLKFLQRFKDNETKTCFLDGLKQYFEDLVKKKNNYAKANLNKLDKFYSEYKDGMNSDDIIKVSKELGVCVEIVDLFGYEPIILNESSLNRFRVKFLNTRYNHIELYKCFDVEPEELKLEEYEKIKNDTKFYVECSGKLFTINNTYCVEKSQFTKTFSEWKIANNWNDKYIIKDSPAYNFLVDNYDFNLHNLYNRWDLSNHLYKEIDLKKAYYNYIKFPCYLGIPSGSFYCFKCDNNFSIVDFEEITANKLVGFFEVQILNYNYDLDKLGYSVGTRHLISSSMVNEIKKYTALKFLNCMYSPAIHIPFTEEFLEKEQIDPQTKISYYVKAYGQMLLTNETNFITIKNDEIDDNYFDLLPQKENVVYYRNNIIKMVKKNKSVKSWVHIPYFIHSYTKTMIFSEIMKIGYDNVLCVKLDSIAIKKDFDYQINNDFFEYKEAKVEKLFKHLYPNLSDLDFGLDIGTNSDIHKPALNTTHEEEYFQKAFTQDLTPIKNRIVFLGGAGGSGKTTSIMKGGNFADGSICYSSLSWCLITAIKEKYNNVVPASIPKLTGLMEGKRCDKIQSTRIRTIIVDEATLIDPESIKQIISMYPHYFILVVGDIDANGFFYQCEIKNVISPLDVKAQTIYYSKSYRFEEDLKQRLDLLRDKMREICDNDKTKMKGNIKKIYKEFKKMFSDRIFKINKVKYDVGDFGISCKDDIRNGGKITKMFLDKGAKPIYYINKTIIEKGIFKGTISYEKPEHNNFEIRLFNTIHSFQGRELGQDNKIIIYLDDLFNFNLFYTAISRARRLDQIFIIDGIN